MFGCYPKKMDGKQEEIHNILVALLSGNEKEIYNVLYKKKEIDDKTPKLRTEDEKKMLKSLSNKMRKFPKDLIDGIQKKFPFLQRTPKTAEQRQEQDKECHSRKRSAESDIDKEMRLTKDKITKHKRYTQATQFRAKKLQELIEKRSKECPLERQTRLNKQKKYEHEKRAAESEIEQERRLTQDKEYHSQKRSEESEIEKERRLNNQKEYNEKRSTGDKSGLCN